MELCDWHEPACLRASPSEASAVLCGACSDAAAAVHSLARSVKYCLVPGPGYLKKVKQRRCHLAEDGYKA